MKTTAEPAPFGLPVSVSAEYAYRLASGPDDVRKAQRLRFEVFNLELGEGLETSFATGLDADPFDVACDHLLVFSTTTGELAGTYRLQTGLAAAAGLGYYSEREFDFAPFEAMRTETIEVGRACVHASHRNLVVLGLLWKGIAAYARERRARYLIGCSSVPSIDPAQVWAAYECLRRYHLAPEELRTKPQPGWEFPPASELATDYSIPKLINAYLGLGARICGEPAFDREFGTADFLTVLDLHRLHPAAQRRFL